MSPAGSTAPPRPWLRRLLNRMEVDRAVFYVLLTRGWQFAAGGVSMLVFAQFFSADELGVYGMFSSLMGLHLLIELGLAGVVAAVASHEWAELELAEEGAAAGDATSLARLANLHQRSRRWYAGMAIVFAVVVGAGGYLFLNRGGGPDLPWEAPWFCLVALNAGSIGLWGQFAVLEGCNQVRAVNRVRFLQALTGNLVVWPAIVLGLSLWAAVVSAVVRLAWDAWLVRVRYGRFFRSLEAPSPEALSWKEQVRPLQWRIALRSIAGFFALQLFAPVIYYYHGEAESGRFWLTWTALTALEGAAFAWVQTRGPLLGMLVARGDWTELDRVFTRVSVISCLVLAAGGLVISAAIALLPAVPLAIAGKVADRLLPAGTTAVFVAAMLTYNVVRCLSLYVQVHKQDPFLVPQFLGCAAAGLGVWWGGKEYGALGEAVGYFAAMVAVFLPLWTRMQRRCRAEHARAV